MAEVEEFKQEIAVMALGGAGCRVLRALSGNPLAAHLRLLAVDTDEGALRYSKVAEENCLLAGARWRRGRGCGGSAIDGQRAVAHERGVLERMIGSPDLLVVVGGLGGGTCSGGAQVILSVARKLDVPVIFLLTMPFTLEGHSKRHLAEETVKGDLVSIADAVLCLPNDLLFSVLDANTPLTDAFRLADAELSRTVLALTSVLRHGNLLASDFGTFMTLVRRRKSYCSIGVGAAMRAEAGEQCNQLAMERLLASPLLGGADRLKTADAVVFSLLGGPELALGESKELLELVWRRPGAQSEVVVGPATSPEWAGMVQLCAVTVKFDAAAELPEKEVLTMERAGRRSRAGSAVVTDDVEQPDLPSFEVVSRGIMEKTTPVIWRGENLDVPTFKRRNVLIDDGKGSLR